MRVTVEKLVEWRLTGETEVQAYITAWSRAHVVSCGILTTQVWVRCQGSPHVLYGGQNGVGADLLRVLLIFRLNYLYTNDRFCCLSSTIGTMSLLAVWLHRRNKGVAYITKWAYKVNLYMTLIIIIIIIIIINSVALVLKRTIPTERPPLVGEVSANFSW
jgi:hypothetical protein